MNRPAAAPTIPRRRVLRAGATLLAAAPVASRASDDAPFDWPVLPLFGGGTLDADALRGQAVVLVMWATWCPYCLRHNPRIEALHRSLAGRPLKVVGAPIDREPDKVPPHLRAHGLTFPNTTQGEALRLRLGLRRIVPTTVTFDRRGRLLQRIPGEMAADDVMGLARLADGPA